MALADDKRLPAVLAHTAGFIYYVSVAGITGTTSAAAGTVEAAVGRIKRHTDLPVAVGFGIRTPEQAVAVARVADAAVVGTALVDAGAEAVAQNRDPVSKVLETAATLGKAVRSARASGAT